MPSVINSFYKSFEACKALAEKAFAQLSNEDFGWQYNNESNSIAVIVKHLSGNMCSRWTNFLTEDGEKNWRKRDEEFINDLCSREQVIEAWHKGWNCLFTTLAQLNDDDLQKTIYIRGEAHSVAEALLRGLSHNTMHVGQIVYIAKMIKDETWQTLSIARNQSKIFAADIAAKK